MIKNPYVVALLGVWTGAFISVFLCRYVTIPNMQWLIAIKMCGLFGLICSPWFCCAVWLAESRNKKSKG